MENFEKARKINPRNSVLHSFLGMALASKQQFGDALKHFEESEKLD